MSSANSPEILIRPSKKGDVPAMLDIYTHHIAQGVSDIGAYESELLRVEDIERRRKNMKNKRLPHLSAEMGGILAGYAYAVPFRKRPAYRYTVKHSIYLHPSYVGVGIGRKLLPALIEACAKAGFFQMIGYIDSANAASLKLHENCGFSRVGLLRAVGLKYGHWTDSVMVQRALAANPTPPPENWRDQPD
jgi:phosphinothricin acetyltransferase